MNRGYSPGDEDQENATNAFVTLDVLGMSSMLRLGNELEASRAHRISRLPFSGLVYTCKNVA